MMKTSNPTQRASSDQQKAGQVKAGQARPETCAPTKGKAQQQARSNPQSGGRNK